MSVAINHGAGTVICKCTYFEENEDEVRQISTVCRLTLIYDLQKRRGMLVNMNINIYTYVVCRAAFGIQIWWMEMILLARCHGGLL